MKRDRIYPFEMKYGKVRKRRSAIVISKNEFSEGIYPASLFFPFVEKSERVL